MREDSELGFRERHPTDLRDRFRLMFPEKYANAGYKLRPVDDQNVLNRTKKNEEKVTETECTLLDCSHQHGTRSRLKYN